MSDSIRNSSLRRAPRVGLAWIHNPLTWILAQATVILIVLMLAGALSPSITTDSSAYLDIPDTFPAMLSHVRTLGYPLFLQSIGWLSPELSVLPLLQALAFVAATVFFYSGLHRYGFSKALAAVIASTLLYSNIFLFYSSEIRPESLSLSLAIITVAFLFHLASKPGKRRWVLWIGFAVTLIATYQVRPAYLFLVLLTPLLGVGLLLIRTRPQKHALARFGMGLAAISIVPFLAFSGLRLAVVGHFGVVSFGGTTLIGIASQLLTEDMVKDLPADSQPLAVAILERRNAMETIPLPSYLASVNRNDFVWVYLAPGTRYDHVWMSKRYNIYIWELSLPVARELYGDDPVRIDTELMKLSLGVIRSAPQRYARWFFGATIRGLAWMTWRDLRFVGLLVVLGCVHMARVLRNREAMPGAAHSLELNSMLLVGCGFALAKLLFVALVAPTVGRYMAASGIFLPGILIVAIWIRISPRSSPPPC